MKVNKYMGKVSTIELINLTQAALSKKQDKMQYDADTWPKATQSAGRVIQYTGEDGDLYKKGRFYWSDGIEWKDLSGATYTVADSLPEWKDADSKTIYFVLNGDGKTVRLYVTGDRPGKFYELGGLNYNYMANTPVINGMSTVNEEDPSKPKEIELRAKVQQYPDSDTYDADAAYPANPDEVRVNKLSLKSLTDSEIQKLYEEA